MQIEGWETDEGVFDFMGKPTTRQVHEELLLISGAGPGGQVICDPCLQAMSCAYEPGPKFEIIFYSMFLCQRTCAKASLRAVGSPGWSFSRAGMGGGRR